MKKIQNKSIVLLGGMAGACLLATLAFANPALLPDHPGHPMKPLKSPVTGQSLANDPGQEAGTGRKALNAATKEFTEDLKTRRSGVVEKEANQSESQNQMKGQNQMGGGNQ